MTIEQFASLSKCSLRVLYGMEPKTYTVFELTSFLGKSEAMAYNTIKELKRYGLAKVDARNEFTLLAHIVMDCVEPIEESKEVEKKRDKEREYISIADDVLKYLNVKAGKNFRATPNTRKYIIARLREEYTADECKRVIDFKVADWGNDNTMSQYLRPQTLFGSKFESYLNSRCTNSQTYRMDRLSQRMDEVMSAPVEDYVLPEELPF